MGFSGDVSTPYDAATALQSFFELSVDLMCVRHDDGYLGEMNHAWQDLLGWTPEELRQQPWLDWIHPDDLEATLAVEQRCQQPQRQTPIDYKNRFRHRNGSYRWLSWRVSPYRNGASVAIAQDVTETQWHDRGVYQRGVQAALYLRDQAIAASRVGIVIADARLPDMPLIYVNPAFEQMSGYSATEVLGLNCRFLQGPEKNQAARHELRHAIKERRHCTVTLRNFRKDGTLFWNELTISPVFDEAGELTHFVGIQANVTQRIQAEKALLVEKNKSERLLLNVLPRPIADQLKRFEGSLAQQFSSVTILFADLVSFSSHANQFQALELISTLNQIFSVFDQLAETHGVEKIKTIGDAYMAAAGLPLPRADHAEAIAAMALDMQQAIQQFHWPDGSPMELRIGIHTGSVVAGVIGIKKFIYDLWGDAVNVAARMESHGKPQRIQITAATQAAIAPHFICQRRGILAIKGKGPMETYWLCDRRQ